MATASPTPTALVAGRHLFGMAIVALAHPLIYYGGGAYQWSVALGAALFGAAVVYGLYALFFTRRAKAAWPRSFWLLAWVLLVLVLAQAWVGRAPQPAVMPAQAAPADTLGENDKVIGPAPASGKTFTYEEAMGLPPAKP